MRRLIVSVCLPLASLLLPLGLGAAPPPLFAYLSNRLANLNSQVGTLDTRIADETAKHRQTLAQAQKLARQSVSLGRWPQPLTTLTQLASGRLEVAQLVGHLRQQTAQNLAKRQQQLATLTSLRQQAQQKSAEIADLQSRFTGKKTRLTPEQKIALATAAANADQLALGIQTALTPQLNAVRNPILAAETLAPLSPSSRRLPVAGKLQATTTGLLFTAAAGSDVTAPVGGKVLYAGPFRRFGGLVILETAPRTQHVFAGLDTIQVKAGHALQSGAPLGRLPGRGPAHLYWEVRKNGKPLPASKILAL